MGGVRSRKTGEDGLSVIPAKQRYNFPVADLRRDGGNGARARHGGVCGSLRMFHTNTDAGNVRGLPEDLLHRLQAPGSSRLRGSGERISAFGEEFLVFACPLRPAFLGTLVIERFRHHGTIGVRSE